MSDDARAVALFPARALGDGLLALVLAHNLHLEGRPSVVYHSQLTQLRAWFPWARIEMLPDATLRRDTLAATTACWIGDPALLPAESAIDAERVYTKSAWDRSRPYLRSLQRHAEHTLGVTWASDENGIEPSGEDAAHPRRVVLHPFSARSAKDWPVARWCALAERLQRARWQPVVLLAPGDEERWRAAAGEAVPVAVPGRLDAVARWLYESGAAVAGDSGIGHLASNVGVPTLSLFRKASAARFWRPVWGRTAVVSAPWRLPGGTGHRYWGRLLSARRVAARFARFAGPAPL